MMLKQVDLPAPFGPISARNSPCATAKLTSSTARTAPKLLHSEATASSLMPVAAAARELDERADEPGRKSQHQHKNDAAEQRVPIFGLLHDEILQHGEHRRADDRARQGLNAAEQHHDQPVDGAADADRFRRDRALGEGEDAAGDAAHSAGDGEAEPVHALDVDADGFGAQRRSRGRRASHSRTAQTGCAAAAVRRQRHSTSVSRKNSDSRSNGALGQMPSTPLEPPVKLLPLENDRPDDLREGERQHGEIDAGKPHGEPAEQQRAERGRDRRERQRHAHRRREPFHGKRRAIGAEAEISGVAEGMHAARPHDEMQAGREQHRDQHIDAEHERVGLRARQQRQHSKTSSTSMLADHKRARSRADRRLVARRRRARRFADARAGPADARSAPSP